MPSAGLAASLVLSTTITSGPLSVSRFSIRTMCPFPVSMIDASPSVPWEWLMNAVCSVDLGGAAVVGGVVGVVGVAVVVGVGGVDGGPAGVVVATESAATPEEGAAGVVVGEVMGDVVVPGAPEAGGGEVDERTVVGSESFCGRAETTTGAASSTVTSTTSFQG